MNRFLSIGLIASIFWSFLGHQAEAAHLVGGEMSYQCLGNGDYQVRVKIYRDCNGTGAPFDDSISVAAFRNMPGFPMVRTKYLYHGAITQLPATLNNPCLQAPPSICTEFTIYQGIINLPPAIEGYTLSHQRCCRNPTVSNVPNPGDWGNTFLAIVPGNSGLCNNSPSFNFHPPVVMCLNDSLAFDHSATDPDGDSLYYSLCNAFHGGSRGDPYPQPPAAPPYVSVPFVAGLNASNPMPANPPIQVDPVSGLLTGRPTVQGQYLFTVCVEEYRNGQLISTVRRDFQFNVTNCQSNVVSAITFQPQLSIPTRCNGTTVNFEHTSTGAQTFLWQFNDPGNPGAFSTSANPVYTYTDTGQFTVRLIVNPGTPCADSSEAVFQLNYPLDPAIVIEGDLCFDSQAAILRAAGNWGANARFQWEVNGQAFTGNPVNLPPLSSAGPHQVVLAVEDFGCSAFDTAVFSFGERLAIRSPLSPISGCAPFTISLDDSVPTDVYTRHFWRFGDGNSSSQAIPTHTYTTAGTYTVEHLVFRDTLCQDTVFRRYTNLITVLNSPTAFLLVSPEAASIYQPFFVLRDSSSADVSSKGTLMGDGTEYFDQDFWSHAYADTGHYTIAHWVENTSGCTDTFRLQVQVFPSFRLYVPSAFRPNGDGINDEFRLMGSGWRKMEFYVYDRWGGELFRSTDGGAAWNGRRANVGDLLPEGVYSWRALVWGERGEFEERMGTVMLLR